MRTFRSIRKHLAPSWLTTDEGELVGWSLDLIKDAFIERIRLGLLARLPQNDPNGITTAPEDALVLMGRDRRVVRGIDEPAASYAVRLKTWLDDRHKAGSAYMLLQKLAEYTAYASGAFSFRTVDDRGNWYSRDADGVETRSLEAENWNWDGGIIGERWSRFWVVIYPDGYWTESPVWGAAGLTWADDEIETWGTTAPREHVVTTRFLVNDWKPAGTRCVNIIIALDANSFDPTAPEPDGSWGRWSKNVDGVMVASRLSTARYWSGLT